MVYPSLRNRSTGRVGRDPCRQGESDAEIGNLGIRFYGSLVVGPLQQVLGPYRCDCPNGCEQLD